MSDSQCMLLHQPFMCLKSRRISKDLHDKRGANTPSKKEKRRHQFHAVSRQTNFSTKENLGIKGTIKQLKYITGRTKKVMRQPMSRVSRASRASQIDLIFLCQEMSINNCIILIFILVLDTCPWDILSSSLRKYCPEGIIRACAQPHSDSH